MAKLRILPWSEAVMLLQATAYARDCEPHARARMRTLPVTLALTSDHPSVAAE